MPSIALDWTVIGAGVGTHEGSHVAVTIDRLDGRLDEFHLSAAEQLCPRSAVDVAIGLQACAAVGSVARASKSAVRR